MTYISDRKNMIYCYNGNDICIGYIKVRNKKMTFHTIPYMEHLLLECDKEDFKFLKGLK